jgi:hypothetical protein
VKAKQIDFLIINCSLFSPTPSLCAMVAHRFQMRSDLMTFNLSGMGCSASLVSIDLAQRLLQQRPGSLAVSARLISPPINAHASTHTPRRRVGPAAMEPGPSQPPCHASRSVMQHSGSRDSCVSMCVCAALAWQVVVSTENLTQALYHGNDRAFLLQNMLFRCGGAAILLSNKVDT